MLNELDGAKAPREVLALLQQLPAQLPANMSAKMKLDTDEGFARLSGYLSTPPWSQKELWKLLHLLSRLKQDACLPSVQVLAEATCATIIFDSLYPQACVSAGGAAIWRPEFLSGCAVQILLGLLQETTAALHECLSLPRNENQPDVQLQDRTLLHCCDMIAALLTELCKRRASVLRQAWLPMLAASELVWRAMDSGCLVPVAVQTVLVSVTHQAALASKQARFAQTANATQLSLAAACSVRAARAIQQARGDEPAAGADSLSLSHFQFQELLSSAVVYGNAFHSRFILPRIAARRQAGAPCTRAEPLNTALAMDQGPEAVSPEFVLKLYRNLPSCRGNLHAAVLHSAWCKTSEPGETTRIASSLQWGALVPPLFELLHLCSQSSSVRLFDLESTERALSLYPTLAFACDSDTDDSSLGCPAIPVGEHQVSSLSSEQLNFCCFALIIATRSLANAAQAARAADRLSQGQVQRWLHPDNDGMSLWGEPAALLVDSLSQQISASKANASVTVLTAEQHDLIYQSVQLLAEALVDLDEACEWQHVKSYVTRSHALLERLNGLNQEAVAVKHRCQQAASS